MALTVLFGAAKMPNTRRSPFRRARGRPGRTRCRGRALKRSQGGTKPPGQATGSSSHLRQLDQDAVHDHPQGARATWSDSMPRPRPEAVTIIRRPVHHVVPTTVRMTAMAAIHKSVDSVGPCRALACSVYCVRDTAPSPAASGGLRSAASARPSRTARTAPDQAGDRRDAAVPRVPTRFVRKYTARAQLKPLGAPEPASGRGRPAAAGDRRGSVRNKRTFWLNSLAARNMTGSVFRICQKIPPKPHSMDRPVDCAAGRSQRDLDLRAHPREAPLPWVPTTAAAAREAHR